MAKPIKSPELHYPMIQFFIIWNIPQVTCIFLVYTQAFSRKYAKNL